MAGLASSNRLSPTPAHALYWYPSSILLANSIYPPPAPKTTKIALLISKGMREPQTRSPRAGAGLLPVLQGQLLSSPASRSPGSPGSKHASGWEVAHSVHTLTHTGSPWAQAVTWHGSLVASRGCSSPLLPLISSGT